MSSRLQMCIQNPVKHLRSLKLFCHGFDPLSAIPTKWSNTLKQFVSNLPMNCLSVFDHFVKLALKGLRGIHGKFDICHTDYNIHSKLRIFPSKFIIHVSMTFKLSKC